MIDIPTEDVMKAASQSMEQMGKKREELRAQAMKFLYDNQECYVAQWILQNPFANPADYALKFTYNDESLLGYSVTMEKINV